MPMHPTKTGCLLFNLGTPASPEIPDVRRFLREMLSDSRLLDMPALGRWLLLNVIILPFRPARSSHSYRSIWTPDGSPLLVHGSALRDAVQSRLGAEVPVALGMRYGEPSLKSALENLRQQGVNRIVVLPLYPHTTASTVGTGLEALYKEVASWWDVPSVTVVEPYYTHPRYLDAQEAVAGEVLEAFKPDHVLFSYHSVPESHLHRSGHTPCTGECPAVTPETRFCYRAQCFATSRALAERFGLLEGRYTTSFQSRMGRVPWIQPYTDHTVERLAKSGVKRLAVLSPAFTADCLESLEEIGIQARESFKAHGGEDFQLVPSLNAHPAWVDAVVDLLAPHLSAPTGASA